MDASTSLHRAAIVILAVLMVLPLPSASLSAEDGDLTTSYEYHFSAPTVDLESDERTFTLQGLSQDAVAGAPSLPVENLLLALQPGYTLKNLEVGSSSPSKVEIISDYPRNPFESPAGNGTVVEEIVDRGSWDLAGTYVLEGVEIVCLNLRPLVWDSRSGQLTFISDFTVTIVSEETGIDWLGDLDMVREMVDNPDEVPYLDRLVPEGVLPTGSYEHLIITDEALTAPFLSLAEWKGERNERGSSSQDITSVVVTLQFILAQSAFWGTPSSHDGTGNDTQTIVRNFIIAAHQEWGVSYVLIGGDEEVIPSRKVWVSYSTYSDELPADIYFTCLDGDWDSDLDGVYGESYVDGTDMLAEVYVGRAPVSNVQEAWNFVNNTIEYEKGYVSQYSVDLLFVGEYLDDYPTYGDDYKDEVYDNILADKGLSLTTLYAKDDTFSASAFISAMNTSPHIINHMGHGNYGTFAGLSVLNAANLNNEHPFIVYTQACMVAGFDQGTDYPYDSIAEEFVIGENGAAAFIGNSRYGWYSQGSTSGSSQKFDLSFFSQVFDDDVTQLGKAMSQSKQELVGSASSANTIRWVYMEQNLLGDPETSVKKAGQGTHDLAVQEISADAYVLGEETEVNVLVSNNGDFPEEGNVSLMADDVLVDQTKISITSGQSTWVTLSWTPTEARPYVLTAVVECATDGTSENDQLSVEVRVYQRISNYTLWENLHKELAGSLIIDDGATLDIRNCTIEFLSAGSDHQVQVNGTLLVNGSSFSGSSYVFMSNGGVVRFSGSDLSGLSTTSPSTMDGGSLELRDTIVHGGMGWSLEGASVTLSGTQLLDQSSECLFNGSSLVAEGVTGHGGGLYLLSSSGQLSNVTWTEGSVGLTIDTSSGLVLRNIELLNNEADLSISGTLEAHFLPDLERVNVTFGPVVILHQEDGVTVEGDIGALYLVDCHDTVVRGLRLGGSGQGLTLVDCTGIEVIGNAVENCSVGIWAMGSDALIWSNDLLNNERQVCGTSSTLTFGKDYPAGGNHWSDHLTIDHRNGVSQSIYGADGIVDVAYDTDDVYDHYPKVSLCSIFHDKPEADFSVSPAVPDVLVSVIFTDYSDSGSGIANWTWDLGDGTLAYGSQVSHRYSVKGPIIVELIVTDHKGLNSTCDRDLNIVNYAPTSDFSYSPTQPCSGDLVHFTDHSSDADGGVVTWSWSFGDGTTSDVASPNHAFRLNGDYTVTLTVLDADGGTSTRSRNVPVGNMAPTAAFSWSPSSIYSLDQVTFTDGSTDSDGSIASRTWSFGDGQSGTGSSVVHRYARLGTYQVTLTVVDDNGASSTTSKSLTVLNSPPTASFVCTGTVLSLIEVHFNDTSSDREGTLDHWSWDFGDGNGSTASSPVHAYALPGEYLVVLTVTDQNGASRSASRTVVVLNRPPEASIISPEGEHWSLDLIELQATGSDVDGTIASYNWDFGDGSTGEGETVEHAYSSPGNYTVALTCVDDVGGSATAEATVVVLNLLPEARIIAEQGTGHPRDMVLTADAEDLDGSVTNYTWAFGDGGSGEGPSIVHRYELDGDFWVSLTVTDDHGGRNVTFALVSVRTGDIAMNNATCTEGDDGWTLSAVLTNDGPLDADVVVEVEAGGVVYRKNVTVLAGGSVACQIPLTDFAEGDLTVSVITEEGWDSDLDDNQWTGTPVASADEFPWLLVGALTIATIAIAAVVIVQVRRR
ncbi:MAG: PKD domain-containing protein [Methanomassiliicoccales archaeon]|nr:PKD domain-containing protein [Methanomassiliicoccales archaeon]